MSLIYWVHANIIHINWIIIGNKFSGTNLTSDEMISHIFSFLAQHNLMIFQYVNVCNILKSITSPTLRPRVTFKNNMQRTQYPHETMVSTDALFYY